MCSCKFHCLINYIFLSLKVTFLEALFWDSSTNDTFSCSKSKKNYKIPQRARPDNTRHIAIKPFSRLLLNYYIKHMIKRPFSCNTMLSVMLLPFWPIVCQFMVNFRWSFLRWAHFSYMNIPLYNAYITETCIYELRPILSG